MEPDRDEKSTAATLTAGLLIIAGFFVLLAALPLGVFLSLRSLPDGWSWRWFLTTGAATTAIVAAAGLGLIYIASAICRRQWGFWPNVFWSSQKKET